MGEIMIGKINKKDRADLKSAIGFGVHKCLRWCESDQAGKAWHAIDSLPRRVERRV